MSNTITKQTAREVTDAMIRRASDDGRLTKDELKTLQNTKRKDAVKVYNELINNDTFKPNGVQAKSMRADLKDALAEGQGLLAGKDTVNLEELKGKTGDLQKTWDRIAEDGEISSRDGASFTKDLNELHTAIGRAKPSKEATEGIAAARAKIADGRKDGSISAAEAAELEKKISDLRSKKPGDVTADLEKLDGKIHDATKTFSTSSAKAEGMLNWVDKKIAKARAELNDPTSPKTNQKQIEEKLKSLESELHRTTRDGQLHANDVKSLQKALNDLRLARINPENGGKSFHDNRITAAVKELQDHPKLRDTSKISLLAELDELRAKKWGSPKELYAAVDGWIAHVKAAEANPGQIT